MGATITNIAVHHSGGIGQDQFASSAHLSAKKISDAHKIRWDFPSKHMRQPASPVEVNWPWYAGYNVIYDPKDRSFTQTRAIGEETAAQYGHNKDTFSICIIGNYMTLPGSWPRQPVDELTHYTVEDVTKFLHDLIDGNRRNLFVVPGTVASLTIARVQPHRFYQQTECYGDFMGDAYFRDRLIAYKPVRVLDTEVNPGTVTPVTQLEQRNRLIQSLLQLVAKMQDLIFEMQNRKVGRLGMVGGRSCEGFIRLNS